MGKHSKGPRTDQGVPFEDMTPEQKATEFDASDADPRGYAETNFPGSNLSAEAWAAQRAQQIADLAALRDQT